MSADNTNEFDSPQKAKTEDDAVAPVHETASGIDHSTLRGQHSHTVAEEQRDAALADLLDPYQTLDTGDSDTEDVIELLPIVMGK